MVRIALRMSGPYWLQPWRSPMLRWRMETYGVQDEQGRLLYAADITPTRFVRFMTTHHRAWWAFLHWAASLPDSRQRHRMSGA